MDRRLHAPYLCSGPDVPARTGWGPDYDDPFTYLDMWDSRGGWNNR